MPALECCECGEIKDGESSLESHISVEHLLWMPYECVYCLSSNRCTRKATKQDLLDHLANRHKGLQTKIVVTPDEQKEKLLKDKVELSRRIRVERPEPDDDGRLPFNFSTFPAAKKIKLETITIDDDQADDFTPSPIAHTPKLGVDAEAVPASPPPPPDLPTPNKSKSTSACQKLPKCSWCLTCNRQYKNIRNHLLHMHSLSPIFKCPQCSKKSSHENNMQQHIARNHGIGAQPVRIRSMEEVKVELERLKQMHTIRDIGRDRGAKSQRIRYRSTGVVKAELEQLKQVHLTGDHSSDRGDTIIPKLPDLPFKCEECNRGVSKHVVYHIYKYHLKTDPFVCPVCSWGGEYKSRVQEHMDKVHPDSDTEPVDRRPQYKHQAHQMAKNIIVANK